MQKFNPVTIIIRNMIQLSQKLHMHIELFSFIFSPLLVVCCHLLRSPRSRSNYWLSGYLI